MLLKISVTEPKLVPYIIALWCRLVLRVHKTKKVAFVYLANDLIQKTLTQLQQVKQGKLALGPDEAFNFTNGFEKVIEPILTKLFELLWKPDYFQIKIDVMKVVKVWI